MSTPRTNQDFRVSDSSDEKYHKVIDKIYSLVNFEHSDIGKSRDEVHLDVYKRQKRKYRCTDSGNIARKRL